MIDFSTLQGLTVPEGVVTQIADASGNVLWKLETSKPIVLEVEKITSDTYAGETTYTGEQFVLLDIYPKTNGTVKVTYGGLTKTITDTSGAESPNAVQVFFGTFNGVSDSVETPDSGELTIEGDCASVAVGSYAQSSKSISNRCHCVTSIVEMAMDVRASAFYECTNLTNVTLLEGATAIGNMAFFHCTALTSIELPSGLISIGNNAFVQCTSLTGTFVIPASVTTIGENPFRNVSSIILTVEDGNTSYCIKNNCLMENATGRLITGFSDSAIPANTIIIGSHAFCKCTDLTNIELPSGLISIEDHAFYYCTSLTGTLVIPASVTTIGENAFFSDGFTRIEVLSATPPSLGQYAFGMKGFNSCSVDTIVVPAGCGDTYKTTEYWSDYADYIVEAS